MRQFGLIGKSLRHSFSQKYFTQKFTDEGITGCEYFLFPLAGITELPALLASHPQLEGINVTIPYKNEVLAYVDDTSNLPDDLQAANCIRIQQGKLIAYNTDAIGFESSFRQLWQPDLHRAALVLGNGGAAQAVKHVLRKLGIDFKVVGRTMKQDIDLLFHEIDAQVLGNHQVIVNTTPLGTFPNLLEKPELPYQYLQESHYLYDLVYNPSETAFLLEGKRVGATIKNGSDMLVLQAEESWRIWNS